MTVICRMELKYFVIFLFEHSMYNSCIVSKLKHSFKAVFFLVVIPLTAACTKERFSLKFELLKTYIVQLAQSMQCKLCDNFNYNDI